VALALISHSRQPAKYPSSTVAKHIRPKDPERPTLGVLGVKFFRDGDEGFGFLEYLQYDVTMIINKMPREDKPAVFINAAEGRNMCAALFQNALGNPAVYWDDWHSPATLSRLVFYGQGQYYLGVVKRPIGITVPAEAVFEVSMASLFNYTVRPGFERYGAIAYFDGSQECVGVWWCSAGRLIPPEDPDFSHASAIFRASLGARATLREHLTHSHWIVANGLVLASERHLNHRHPLRCFLRPHTYHCADINLLSAVSLAGTDSLTFRLFGFHEDVWLDLVTNSINSFRYETLEEHFYGTGLPETLMSVVPFYQDGLELWHVFRRYCENYINIFYPTDVDLFHDLEVRQYWADFSLQLPERDMGLGALNKTNLIKHLTFSLWWVTAGHEFSGGIADFERDPSATPGKLRVGQDMADVQTYALTLALTSLTSLNMPKLMDDWTVLHGHLDHDLYIRVKACLGAFQSELKELSEAIDARNTVRLQRFESMNPSRLDSSASM